MSAINRNHKLQSLMILIFCLIGHSLKETSTPQNLAVVKGTSIRLNCSKRPDHDLVWSFFNSSDSDQTYPKTISIGVRVVQNHKGQFSLDISTEENVDLLFKASENVSGMFSCHENGNGIQLCSVQIIVLDPEPNCSKEETDDGSVKVDCSLGFSGFWTPELEWLKADVKLKTDDTTTPNKVTSSHLVKYKSPAPYDLTCTPKFTLKNKPPARFRQTGKQTVATNIPEFPNSCTIIIEPSEGGNEPPPIDESKENATISIFPSATVSIHDWHNLHLSLSLATLVFIGMLHKWLWQ